MTNRQKPHKINEIVRQFCSPTFVCAEVHIGLFARFGLPNANHRAVARAAKLHKIRVQIGDTRPIGNAFAVIGKKFKIAAWQVITEMVERLGQEVEDPLMRQIRYLDKLVDELAKGRPMEKVLRT